jgi:hypothetical protein
LQQIDGASLNQPITGEGRHLPFARRDGQVAALPQFGEILQIVRAAQGFFPPEDVRTGPLDQARDLDRFAEWSGSPQIEHQPSLDPPRCESAAARPHPPEVAPHGARADVSAMPESDRQLIR